MSPRDVLSFCLLSLVISALVVPLDSSSGSPSCRPDQRDYLLRFKNSFSISGPPPSFPFVGFLCLNTSYPKTLSWRENEDCCSWDGITCDVQSGVVIGLDLSCSLLLGTIDSNSSLFSLRHLRTLSLAGNYFLGSSILPELGIFAGMTHLNLSSSGFLGVVPTEISGLSKLVTLDLSNNCIGSSCLELQSPTMSSLVRNLTALEEIDFTLVNMSAVIPTPLANFTSYLTSLKLVECWLRGELPDNIFQLQNLHTLDLSGNDFLSGILPQSNWSSDLVSLSLGRTSFTGEIPRSIGNLSRLTFLDLSWTNFTGYINIKTFASLENLRVLELPGTSVSGDYAIDEHRNFPKLEVLDIGNGILINFPCFMSSMPQLRELGLDNCIITEVSSQCDSTSLVFPRLEMLTMPACNFTKFPLFLSRSEGLITLDLSGNMFKEIPDWFWGIGIDTLEFLDLESNLAEGDVKLPWRKLRYLNLHNNSFEGPLPVPSQSIQTFYASQNRFNGSIPPRICELPSLLRISLAQNNLTGIIPQCLGNITGLEFVKLSNNLLTGPLPRSLASCTSLQILDLSYNNISDTPPVWLAAASLRELHLQSNHFEGTWPTDFFLEKSLTTLDLSSNKFEGPPPCPSDTAVYYMISSNNFSGEIGSCVCKAGNLRILDMSNNGLTGNLPECLKNITITLVYLGLDISDCLVGSRALIFLTTTSQEQSLHPLGI